jgi:hypothetical protein
MGGKMDQSISRRFGTQFGTTPKTPFSGEGALKFVSNLSKRSKQVTDFFLAYPNISGWNIGKVSNMSLCLDHPTLAEAHNFPVGFIFRIEIYS